MRPADRIELITRCARTLAARNWQDIDFYLDQFGLPTQNEWDDQSEDSQFNYCRHMLGSRGISDKPLLALDDYLHGTPTHDEGHEPWQQGIFKVFISHLASSWATANAVKAALSYWGLDAFVAHKDIEPGAEWVRVITAALHSCDALVALLHEGFKESNWCDQEVGVAFGRAVPVIPIKVDIDPYGFLGTFQAISWPSGPNPDAKAVQRVIQILLKDKRTAERVVEAIVYRLERSPSYGNANDLSAVLANSDVALSDEQVTRLREAQKKNDQLLGAWHVEASLTKLEKRLGISKPPTPPSPPSPVPPIYDYGEEPF